VKIKKIASLGKITHHGPTLGVKFFSARSTSSPTCTKKPEFSIPPIKKTSLLISSTYVLGASPQKKGKKVAGQELQSDHSCDHQGSMPRKQAPEFFGVSFLALYFLVLSSPESSVWNNNCQNAGMNIEGWNAHHFPKEWFQHKPQFMEAFHFQSFH
jgi:hypothetical protein